MAATPIELRSKADTAKIHVHFFDFFGFLDLSFWGAAALEAPPLATAAFSKGVVFLVLALASLLKNSTAISSLPFFLAC